MKAAISIFITCAFLFLSACATSSYSVGKDFPSDNVSKIEKGKTTESELVKLFGEPFSKSVISSTEEKWVYTYQEGTASAKSSIVTTKVETKGILKTLDILIENGVVTNYTYTENPVPGSVQYQ